MVNEITPERIIKLVADNFGCSVEQLKSRSRKRSIILKRYLAVRLIDEYTYLTLKEISKSFGRNNHHFAMYACRELCNIILREELDEGKVKQTIKQLNEETGRSDVIILSLISYERVHRDTKRNYIIQAQDKKLIEASRNDMRRTYTFDTRKCERGFGSVRATL